MSISGEIIQEFIEEVSATRKYRNVCEDTIRDVIESVLPRYKCVKDAKKAARTKLHRIQAAYLGRNVIGKRLDEIRASCRDGNEEQLKEICLELMQDHASTRERIPIIGDFYEKIFTITGRPDVLLDVACGVHPLSVPWMNLPRETVYHAYEITRDLVDDLNGFMVALGRIPLVKFQDVICRPPEETGDLAFLFKMVPCLERREKGIAIELIENLKVRYVVVSFPVHSLSGRSRNMPAFYTETFSRMLEGRDWSLRRVPVEKELVFVVDKK